MGVLDTLKETIGLLHLPENLPEQKGARDAAGKTVGVSGKTVDFATRVLSKGRLFGTPYRLESAPWSSRCIVQNAAPASG